MFKNLLVTIKEHGNACTNNLETAFLHDTYLQRYPSDTVFQVLVAGNDASLLGLPTDDLKTKQDVRLNSCSWVENEHLAFIPVFEKEVLSEV